MLLASLPAIVEDLQGQNFPYLSPFCCIIAQIIYHCLMFVMQQRDSIAVVLLTLQSILPCLWIASTEKCPTGWVFIRANQTNFETFRNCFGVFTLKSQTSLDPAHLTMSATMCSIIYKAGQTNPRFGQT